MPPVYRTLMAAAMPGLTALSLLGVGASAKAHSNAELDARFEVRGARVDVTMRLLLRDLRHMVLVDRNQDGRMSPQEVVAARPALDTYLQRTLKLSIQAGACRASLEGLRIVDFSSVDAHLRFTCPEPSKRFTLSSGLFGGTGHSYRMLARFQLEQSEQRVEISNRVNRVEVELGEADSVNVPWVPALAAAASLALVAAGLVLLLARRRRRSSESNP